jgi:hypothetical protein
MTQTASQYLAEVTSKYTPSTTMFDGAKSHRASIESRLDDFLGLNEMFETGSLRHGTGVQWFSDADYMASLKGIQPGSEVTTLNKVKETLQARFPTTEIVVRRPAVVCKFGDGTVEVTPAYPAYKQSGSQDGYWIPDPRGGWMQTHPKDHNAYVNMANQKHGGAAKKLARQAKIWKYKRSVPISSCYLEMRAAKYADSQTAWLPVWDLHDFLKDLLDKNLAAMNDPTGLGSRFGATSSDSNHADAISKLTTAVLRAARAKAFERDDKHVSAIEQLKLLFDQ